MHHAFLYISLPLLHVYDVKMPIFTFFWGRTEATGKFLSLFKLECVPQEINSREICLHKTFSGNWNKRDKVWKTLIHFKSDGLAPVAVNKKMQLKKFPDSRGPCLSGVSHCMISYFARATRNRPDIDVLQSYPDGCGNVGHRQSCQRHFDMIVSIT